MRVDLRANPAFCPPPPFAATEGKKETAAQANGRRYEEKALPFLSAWAKGRGYQPLEKPWITYRDLLGRVRYCQPDFLAIGESTDNILLVEVKLRHTRTAFNQLRLYRELLSELYPEKHIIPLEVCRYFDKSEFNCELLPEVREHPFTYAAALWEPPVCSLN